MIKRIIPNITTILFRNVGYNYVRKKDIDQICSGYSNSKLDQIKMYTRMFAHIGKQGFKGAKNDVNVYKSLRDKPRNLYTSQDWNQLIRIYHDFFRLGPLLIIQALPMSGPLFVLYMYTYPGSIPSWFIIDKFHEDYQKRIRVVQLQAIQYFRQKNIKPQNIDFDSMNLEQARKLAECLYGYHRDGTLGWNKIFKNDIQFFISQSFSKYLIKRKLKYKFNADLQHKNELQGKTFNQKIIWKYTQVMVKGKLLKRYEDTLTAEQLRIRQQQGNAESIMQNQGNKKTIQQKQK